jgi:hypothetical protein
MPTVRRSRAEIDEAKLIAELAARQPPSEAEIDAQAAEDADAWSDTDLVEAAAAAVRPRPGR